MNGAKYAAQLVALLQRTVDRETDMTGLRVDTTSALIGPHAIIASLSLVSFIADAEIMLSEDHGLELVLVSEAALSRSKSPFLTIETLAAYIAELAGADS